eukprot:4391993-Prymnesium_polylepis.1
MGDGGGEEQGVPRPRAGGRLTGHGHHRTLRGAAHGFGNTEERLIRMNFGVEARDGEQRFNSATGAGAVRAHQGVYHDALFVKGNT